MHTKEQLLKIKWESLIRLEVASDRLKNIKAEYYKACLLDLPRLPKEHPGTIKINEDLDKMYKDIVLIEEDLNNIRKDVEKLLALIRIKSYSQHV